MTSAQDNFDMVAGSGNHGIQFDGKNIPNWKYSMEILLLRQGILDIVRGTTTRPTDVDATDEALADFNRHSMLAYTTSFTP